jgi:hypothetical protein
MVMGNGCWVSKLAWFVLGYYLYMRDGRQFRYISKAAACASLLFTLFCSILYCLCAAKVKVGGLLVIVTAAFLDYFPNISCIRYASQTFNVIFCLSWIDQILIVMFCYWYTWLDAKNQCWRKLQKKKDKGAAAINSFVLYGKKDCIFVIWILLVVLSVHFWK